MVVPFLLRCRRQTFQYEFYQKRFSTTSRFVPRSQFPVAPTNTFTWFPGHMLAGLRMLASTIQDIDLIIEIRDARIPLSSRNPYLEDVCAGKRRLVLYNKRDLAGLTEKQEQVVCLVDALNYRELWGGIVVLVMRLRSRIFMSPTIFNW